MHLDEELYHLALAKEEEYLRLINLRNPDIHYNTLKDALNDYFDANRVGTPKDLSYKDGISKEAAIEMLKEIEKNSAVLDAFMNSKISDFIGREIQQIKGVKEENSDQKVAGYLDEGVAVGLLKNAFPIQEYITEVKTKNNKTMFEGYNYSSELQYKGESGGDFKIIISAIGTPKHFYKAADINEKGEINLENKLNLNSFHIADGTIKLGDSGVSDLEKEYLDLTWESDENHITGDLDYDILEEPSGARNYNKYMTYIRLDTFNQVLANYIMYKKLSTTLPIFISPSSKGLDFKLCSEVIADVSRGHFNLKTGLNKGDTFITTSKNFKTILIDEAIQKVGKYQLWYGK